MVTCFEFARNDIFKPHISNQDFMENIVNAGGSNTDALAIIRHTLTKEFVIRSTYKNKLHFVNVFWMVLLDMPLN